MFGKMFQLPLGLLAQDADSSPNVVADRRIVLARGVLHYGLVRARRRTLGLIVGNRGVEVRAPRSITLSEIERFLREKEAWIWRHLNARNDKRRPFEWADGEPIPVFGQPACLEIRRVASRPKERLVHMEENRLVATIVAGDEIEKVRALVQTWLRGKLLELSAGRVAYYSSRIEVPTPLLRISNARTRWGSCSAAGRVSLNWRLIHMPTRLIDYVVAHEIAHLREMNHSPRFWALLESIYPDCRNARRELNALEKQVPVL